jgi:shikimate kinase
MNIILLGFMGTGKTSIGRELAKRLGMEYFDMDKVIEEEEGISIREIFERYGEPYFRDKESRVCERVGEFDGYVVAAGGGVVLREENMGWLRRNGLLISLTARPEVIYKRTSTERTRPLLLEGDPMKRIKELLHLRDPYYKKADFMIDTSDLSINEVVERIIDYIKEREHGDCKGRTW